MKVQPKLELEARELVELKRIEETRMKEEIKEEGKAGMVAVSVSDEEDDEGIEKDEEEKKEKKLNVIEKLGAGIATIGKKIEEVGGECKRRNTVEQEDETTKREQYQQKIAEAKAA